MIKSLTMHNWMCFKGEHHLDLKPLAYAITATHQENKQLSNASGKSALLELIDFAITGHFNKVRHFDADAWITDGEKSGYVEVVLEDGISIKRERKRGQPTQIRMTNKDGSIASQAVAAAAILKYLRFAEDDFKNVSYFEQRQMARIIHTDSSERLNVIRGWLDLAPAERAEEIAKERASEHIKALRKLKAKREALSSFLTDAQELPAIKPLVAIRDKAHKEVDQTLEVLRQIQQKSHLQGAVDSYKELVKEGMDLAEEVKLLPTDLQELADRDKKILAEKTAINEILLQDLIKKERVAKGEFDGQCPVAPLECPIKDKINKDRKASAHALQEVQEQSVHAQTEKAEAFQTSRQSLDRLEVQSQKQADLDRLRKRVTSLQPHYKEAKALLKEIKSLPDEQELKETLASLRQVHTDAVSAIASIKAQTQERERQASELEAVEKEIKEITKLAAVATQTRSIFRATQRRVAEGVLQRIGNDANSMLDAAGVDLHIDIQWEAEGKKLAKTCEMCGAPFPDSARIKVCEECDAERGMNIIQRLEFLLSKRSGGKDDIGGIALQFAAGAWLLMKRESFWATCIIDEPFGALDQHTRRMLATQLVRMLQGGHVYRQMLCISHSEDTVAMFPGQIHVIVEKNGDRRIEYG